MTDEDKTKIEEGRRLLEALGEQVVDKSPLEILKIMGGIGLAYLRAVKANQDMAKVAQEMSRRIQEGPRPSPEEAAQN